MAINGIGSYGYGDYNNYQSSINEMRLQQILTKNPKAVQAIESINSTGSGLKKSSMDFLKSYNSSMSNLMHSANALKDTNFTGVANKLEITSSDTSVVSISQQNGLGNIKEMVLNVDKLATAQSNVSSGVKGSDTASEDMDFMISGSAGSVNVKVSATNDDGSARTNRDMLHAAAKQINSGRSDVKAVVQEKDGVMTLELEGKKTGSSNDFSVSGNMGAASGADSVKTQAMNAEYRVTKDGGQEITYTSSTNSIRLENGSATATLKETGTVTIKSEVNSDKLIDAVSDLVGSYQAAANLVNANTGRGSGTSTQASKFAHGLASGETLKKLGISTNKDGNLTLDKDVLKKALKEDPSLTKSLISGSNGIAQRAYGRAASAMNTNSSSLIRNDLAELEMQSVNDPFNMMNLYSSSGAYNMKNYYALGMITNFLA